jgi:hypothetical protein
MILVSVSSSVRSCGIAESDLTRGVILRSVLSEVEGSDAVKNLVFGIK